MDCWSCGTRNEPGAKFCINCGAAQARPCDTCGHVNPAAANFCANCGSSLADASASGRPAGSAAPPAPAQPLAERRLVSVLFVDLVGFTTLSEDRDPEDTRELLSRYFEVARRVIEGHGGTVEKFIGDAVMAVWGAPVAHEDDAERAVRAALELVAAVGRLSDGDLQLRARAGVLTGEAAVTIGAQAQGMVAGDLVNTASRLQSAADPGTVLVGEATYRAASESIRFEPAGEKAMKGKAELVPTWRAVEVVAMRGGDRRASALEPPFVGRDDELRQIKDLFESTSRERKPRLVSVIGQAGIGKSRLAWEFEKYLDGVVDDVYWHEGRSPAYGEGISYWALAEMVRRRARIAESDDAETTRGRLESLLEATIPDVEERRWVEPRLAGLLGLAELPNEGREELFSAWRTFLERTAEAAPSVLVFVDLHWADQGMLDFIEYLLSWSRSSPLFVLALARPELLERRPDWGSQVRSVTRINLDPLSEAQMTQLIQGTLPGLDADLVGRIVARSEGIPLYAVETARMLLDTGSVVEREGRYEVVGEVDHLAVAETLQALISARLDATEPEDRSLLQDASVLGQTFTLAALAAVNGGEPVVLEERLERLGRRQLVLKDTDPRSPERGQYRFVQSLVREVAYQTLAKPDRRTRHVSAARYYETLDDEELAAVLATHYLEAFHASRPGPEADALAAQARVALSAAAERASSLHSSRQALRFLEQALEVTVDPAEQAALHLRATATAEFSSNADEGMTHARRAGELFRQLGDATGALSAATWIGRHQIGFHHMDEAIETLGAAISEAEPLGDVPELAACLSELSRVLMLTERHAEAVEVADRALAVAGQFDMLSPTVEALINRGSSLVNVQRRHEAEAVLRGAIALADRHGLVAASLRARNNLASIRYTEDVPELTRLYREGLEQAGRFGHRAFMYQFAFQLADLNVRAGNWDGVLDEIDALEEVEPPPPFVAGSFLAIRSHYAGLTGRLEEAAVLLEESRRMSSSLHSPMVEAFQHVLAGTLAMLDGDWEAAGLEGRPALDNANTAQDAAALMVNAGVAGDLPEIYDEAARLLSESAKIEGLSSRWVVLSGQAGFAARAGKWDQAASGYARALDGLESMGHLLQWAFTSLLWGALGAEHPDAATAMERGRAFFADRNAASTADRFLARIVPATSENASSRAKAGTGEELRTR